MVSSTRTGTANGFVQFVDSTSTKIEAKLWSDFLAEEIEAEPSVMGDALLVGGGRVIIYGDPGNFKSFAAMQLCHNLSLGMDWLGNIVYTTQRTLYLQAEVVDKRQQMRGQKLTDAMGKTDNMMYAHVGGFQLKHPDNWIELATTVEDNGIQFVVLDPLSAFLGGSENDDTTMRPFFNNLITLTTLTGVGIGLVHHSRKAVMASGGEVIRGPQNLRGWSGIEAWSDTIIHLGKQRDLPNTIELIWEKVRHSEPPSRQWLQFDGDCGILKLSEEDPTHLTVAFLDEGPKTRAEFDNMLLKRAAMRPRKAIAFRQELETNKIITTYPDPVDRKVKMVKLRED